MTRDEALEKALVFYDRAAADNVRKLTTDLLLCQAAGGFVDGEIDKAVALARERARWASAVHRGRAAVYRHCSRAQRNGRHRPHVTGRTR